MFARTVQKVAGLNVAAITLAALSAVPAWSAGNPTATNALILKNAATKLAAHCRADGGRPGDMRGAITAADLTGDGLVEWFKGDGYRCDGADSFDGGSGGNEIMIESGQANGGSRQVFDQTVFGIKLERTRGKPVAWVMVGGHYCGQQSITSNALAWSCELPLSWDAKARQLVMAPPSAARHLQKPN